LPSPSPASHLVASSTAAGVEAPSTSVAWRILTRPWMSCSWLRDVLQLAAAEPVERAVLDTGEVRPGQRQITRLAWPGPERL